MAIASALEARARKVRLIAMDIDGVLTGGEILVVNGSEEVKIWNVKDGFGFHLVHRCNADIKFAWITGRQCLQVAERAREMEIDFLYQNCMKKKEALEEIIGRLSLAADEVAYIGDDLVDIPVLRMAGLAVCPADAPEEVRAAVHHVSRLEGGRGVAREVIDFVLKARGLWDQATQGYL